MSSNRIRVPIAAASLLLMISSAVAGCSVAIDGDPTTTSPPASTTADMSTTSPPAATTPPRTSAEAPSRAPDESPPPPPDPAQPAGPVVTVGQPCFSPSAVGTDVNSGNLIVCTNMGSGAGLMWVDSVPIIGINNAGDPCDPTTDGASQTPEGLAVMCINGTWVYGP